MWALLISWYPLTSLVAQTAHSVADLGSIPGSGRFPEEGNSSPLQYSCLENPMDGGAWLATVHGVAKSRIQLSNFTIFLSFFTDLLYVSFCLLCINRKQTLLLRLELWYLNSDHPTVTREPFLRVPLIQPFLRHHSRALRVPGNQSVFSLSLGVINHLLSFCPEIASSGMTIIWKITNIRCQTMNGQSLHWLLQADRVIGDPSLWSVISQPAKVTSIHTMWYQLKLYRS